MWGSVIGQGGSYVYLHLDSPWQDTCQIYSMSLKLRICFRESQTQGPQQGDKQFTTLANNPGPHIRRPCQVLTLQVGVAL